MKHHETSRLKVKKFQKVSLRNFDIIVFYEDSSPDSKLKVCPDYDKGVFDVELFNLEIIENTPCKLVYNDVELETTSTEYMCKWTSVKVTAGQWYHFKAWITVSGGLVKRVSNSWDAVEPAFDVDQFGITVASKETSLEVNLDPSKTAHIWDALIGQKGLLIVTLIDGEKRVRMKFLRLNVCFCLRMLFI